MHLTTIINRKCQDMKQQGKQPYALLLGDDIYHMLRKEFELTGGVTTIEIKEPKIDYEPSILGLVLLEGMLGEFRILCKLN